MMRTFYIFKINQEFSILTKDHPFNLYKNLESIYHLETNDFDLAYKMFEKLIDPIDKTSINNKIFNAFQDNQHYTKYSNSHTFNNYYTDEATTLSVRHAHLVLKSNNEKPIFWDELSRTKNLFVCDFANKDYFWIDKILHKQLV